MFFKKGFADVTAHLGVGISPSFSHFDPFLSIAISLSPSPSVSWPFLIKDDF